MTARMFSDYLREIERGQLLNDLSSEMQALVQAVYDTGKAGALTLKIAIKPEGRASMETVTLTAALDVKLPKPERVSSLFFITPENNLTRRDPRQGDFEDHLKRGPRAHDPVTHDPATGVVDEPAEESVS
jgi:hypothetical protein